MYFFVYYMFPFIALVIFNTAIYRRVSNMSKKPITVIDPDYFAKVLHGDGLLWKNNISRKKNILFRMYMNLFLSNLLRV